MEKNIILDPIHGYIEFDRLKQLLFDTPQMQRLRRIKQLGFTCLVYREPTIRVLNTAWEQCTWLLFF